MKLPLLLSNQYAPCGLLPAHKIAPRSFIETLMTLELKARRIWSATVAPAKFLGDMALLLVVPTATAFVSAQQYKSLPVRLSNHSLPMTPCTPGGDPLK